MGKIPILAYTGWNLAFDFVRKSVLWMLEPVGYLWRIM